MNRHRRRPPAKKRKLSDHRKPVRVLPQQKELKQPRESIAFLNASEQEIFEFKARCQNGTLFGTFESGIGLQRSDIISEKPTLEPSITRLMFNPNPLM